MAGSAEQPRRGMMFERVSLADEAAIGGVNVAWTEAA